MRSQVVLLASALLLLPGLATAEPAASAAPLAPFFACAAPAEAGTLRSEPAPMPMLGCSAQRYCGPGTGCYSVSCSGSVSCTVQSNSVTCDGVTTTCPSSCTAPPWCDDPDGYCDCIDVGLGCGQCIQTYC